MSVMLDSPGPNAERRTMESHSDHDRSGRHHDYSVEFGNELGPVASLPHGTGHGLGPPPGYGRAGWSLYGLSRG